MEDSKGNNKQDVSEKRQERDKEEVIAEGVAVVVNGGFEGFDHRKKNLKAILKLMKVKYACKSDALRIWPWGL
ncbi:hypothetical protein NJT12_23590 [Flavobacterium sp. AC]|uniref:Uncharacterized protein n=1 Tax=Flavobacterium azizsancarii TaxID=2961580 RepID=A0ABT4WKX8_9FLAO|nr:hypothetical protein [Flavobacterium azizsancarii]MDA6072609.1 hypothetical protein [Flavobacterium azizsancarii]